jgi:hypothetical protein
MIELKEKKSKLARKMHFEKDEKEGIKEYGRAIKKSHGKERGTYKEILPEEKEHLNKLRKI